MNVSSSLNMSLKATRRWLAAALAVMLVLTSVPGIARAAEDTVTDIEFEYKSEDYNSSTSSLIAFVEDDKVNLSVFASISGSSSKKNVTADATWKSSNTSFVKVEKGVITGVGKGTSTISATYKNYTKSIKVTSDYIYDSVTLMQNGQTAPDKIEDIELGNSLQFTLNGTKSTKTELIASDAVWTTSSAAIATVDDGTITLVGTGTVTITAKYKGKSDSIIITISSPYKSISIDSLKVKDKLLEMNVGDLDERLSASVIEKTGGTPIVTDVAKWVSGNTKVATVDKGVVTVVGAGQTTITVSHKGVSTSINIVVRTPYQSIRLSIEKEYHFLLQDPALQITAEALNNSSFPSPITKEAVWTSSNVVVATVSEGLVTPKGVGTTRITATHKGVSRSIDVTVYPSIFKLSIEEETIDAFAEESGQFPVVTGTTFDGSKVDVSKLVQWSSEDEKVVSIKDEKWTANKIGESVLTAKIHNIEVDTKLIVHIKPLKLIAEVKDMSIILGKEVDLPQVNVINEDGEEEDVSSRVKWKASSDNIVIKTKTMKGIEPSSLTLTATYLNKTVSVKIKIEEEIVRFEIEPTTISLNPSKSKSIKVTGYYKSGAQVSLGSKMNWVVNNTAIATVKSSTVKAIAVGTTKLTGSYQGKTVEVLIVVSPQLKSLVLSSKSMKLSPGATYNVTLQANYTTGSPVNVTDAATWTSSRANVATVKDGKITALSKGSASIKATFNGKSITFRVTVS